MIRRSSSATIATAALGSAALALSAAAIPAVPAHASLSQASLPPLVISTSGSGVLPPYVRNFNPCAGYNTNPGGTFAVIYEPLFLLDSVQYKQYPWLATAETISKDLKTVTLTIRHGVKWSDGQPFSAQDVYYTLAVLDKKSAQCGSGLWSQGTTSVNLVGSDQVSIHFRTADSTRLYTLIPNMGILPKHIFEKAANPVTLRIPNPVGTGPFTEVQNFTAQGYDLGHNPYYWQASKIAMPAIRLVGFTSGQADQLATEAGQVDWSGTAIPNAARVYDARNPNFHHFYPAGFADNPLFFDDTKYPYSLPAFRKALSMAINRQAIDVNANYGYDPPATATGLDPWPSWIDKSIPNTLVQYNPAAAQAMLKSAGFTLRNGQLFDPHGGRVSFTLIPAFDTAGGQIMAQNFKALGIDVTPQVLQFGPMFDKAQRGTFGVLYGWSNGGPTPYNWYQPFFASEFFKPIGQQDTLGWNWERWTNPQMDKLFAAFRATADVQQQHKIANQMQRIFVDNMPVVPLNEQSIAENYSTAHYTGFPTAANNYAAGQAFAFASDTLLILTRLHPSR